MLTQHRCLLTRDNPSHLLWAILWVRFHPLLSLLFTKDVSLANLNSQVSLVAWKVLRRGNLPGRNAQVFPTVHWILPFAMGIFRMNILHQRGDSPCRNALLFWTLGIFRVGIFQFKKEISLTSTPRCLSSRERFSEEDTLRAETQLVFRTTQLSCESSGFVTSSGTQKSYFTNFVQVFLFSCKSLRSALGMPWWVPLRVRPIAEKGLLTSNRCLLPWDDNTHPPWESSGWVSISSSGITKNTVF